MNAPDAVPALLRQGVELAQQGRLDDAGTLFQQALQHNPDNANAHYHMAVLLVRQQRHEEAATHYEHVIRLRPQHAESHYGLGYALQKQGLLTEATACYRRALELEPGHVAVRNNLGAALLAQRRWKEAVACYEPAVRVDPNHADVCNNLGIALMELGRWDAATAWSQHALRLRPNYAEAYHNLGGILAKRGRQEEAMTQYRKALQIRPEYVDAMVGMAGSLHGLGKFDEAMTWTEQALNLEPTNPAARWNRSVLWLLQGDLERGWPEYEWRWVTYGFAKRSFVEPLWDGSELNGRTILVHAEQGLGDTLQFIRYLPLVKQRGGGGRIIVECQKPLVPLLSRFDGIDELVARGSPLPRFDVQAPLLSLPGILGTSLADIPAEIPYLSADPALVAHWQQQLQSLRGFKIGINWRGSPTNPSLQRDIPLAQFAALAQTDGVQLISLQKGPATDELQALAGQVPIVDLGSRLDEASGPFMDTAAVMKNVDLVISSDTSVPHLAGALGAPVWVALPYVPDWRWLLQRDDSPWYPTMRLFRQQHPGRWEDVFDRIVEELKKRMGDNRPWPLSGAHQISPKHKPSEVTYGDSPHVNAPPLPNVTQAVNLARSHHEQGDLLAEQGRTDDAVSCYQQALHFDPHDATLHNNLGVLLRRQGKLDEAHACYQQALRLKPDYVDAHFNLGNLLQEQRQWERARECYDVVLQMDNRHAGAIQNLGNTLTSLGRLEEAVTQYRMAIQLWPNDANAHNKLGIALENLGQVEEALAQYRCAIQLRPDHADAHSNLGNVLLQQWIMDRGGLEQALACYDEALRLEPCHANANWNRAAAWLLLGDFKRGWPAYEWRWAQAGTPPRNFPQPLWDGSPLDGRTLLLHAEQGLGDTLQFIRYLPVVKRRAGGRVIVECQKPLVQLLSRLDGMDELVARGSPLPAFDVQAPLLSLPGIMNTTLADVPACVPYLSADPTLVAWWRQELQSLGRFKIGINWRGSPTNPSWRRDIPLRQFAALAQIDGVQLISLQKEAGLDELTALAGNVSVLDLGSRLDESSGPFMDTAALMKSIDLVISSDTAVPHLAGALGVPVWVALPCVPDWRWLLQREDSPWYPTMRLFRQRRPGDWEEVFQRMAVSISQVLRELSIRVPEQLSN